MMHGAGDRGLLSLVWLVAIAFLFSTGCSHKSDHLSAGDQAMQHSQWDEAENEYQQAEKLNPSDVRPHLALVRVYLSKHEFQQAKSEAMRVVELEPKNPQGHAALADVYSASSQLGAAEAQSRAAVALDTANAAYRMSLGMILQSEQKLAAAEAEYRTAAGLEPRNAHAHLALAALLNAEPNRQNEAEAEYAEVRALDPSLVPATAAGTATALASANTPVASTAPIAQEPALRQTNTRFLLTHDSPVYESMNDSSRVVAQVHRRKYVHVIGLGGQWLRIQLRNGTIGFIPATAAE